MAEESPNGSPKWRIIRENTLSMSYSTGYWWWSVPSSFAASWDQADSSWLVPGNEMLKVFILSESFRLINAVTRVESIPPLRNDPRGTSDTRRIWTASEINSSSSVVRA